MTTSTPSVPASSAARVRTGWWMLIVTAALLVLNGVWLVFNLASPDTIAQDTGVSIATVEGDVAALLDAYARQGATLGLLVTGIGLVALSLSWLGRSTGERSARIGLVAVFVTVAAVAGRVVVGGRWDVALVWLAYAGLLLAGIVLTARRPSVP